MSRGPAVRTVGSAAALLLTAVAACAQQPQPPSPEPFPLWMPDGYASSLAAGDHPELLGTFEGDSGWLEVFDREGQIYFRSDGAALGVLHPRRGAAGTFLMVNGIPGSPGLEIELQVRGPDGILVDGVPLRRRLEPRPAAAPAAQRELIGHYRGVGDYESAAFLIHERRGDLYLQAGALRLDRLEPADGGWRLGADSWYPGADLVVRRDVAGGIAALRLGEIELTRDPVGAEHGETFRIEPTAPIAQLRAAALAASPPEEQGPLRAPDLLDLASVHAGIRFDVRYASTNNFMGAAFYDEPRAFMQRPAAEALGRVLEALQEEGFGLLVHDAYRPWYVTKMFWDATPESQRRFVADPANGSRHNRGRAVDLTLYDLASGEVIEMTGGYDEFSERSYPFYAGGTSRQRWHRDLLRRYMEAEGFAVYEYEWWHFDYQDWRHYPILDLTFDRID